MAAIGAREYLMLQRLFNALRIKAHNELTVDLKSRNAHDLVGYQCFPGAGVLCNVPFNVGDMLF